MDDTYLDLTDEQWDNIAMMPDVYRDKKPIVEYDVDNKKIYTYPANDYIDMLTARTRNETKKLYEEARKNNQFLLFIKDLDSAKFSG